MPYLILKVAPQGTSLNGHEITSRLSVAGHVWYET